MSHRQSRCGSETEHTSNLVSTCATACQYHVTRTPTGYPPRWGIRPWDEGHSVIGSRRSTPVAAIRVRRLGLEHLTSRVTALSQTTQSSAWDGWTQAPCPAVELPSTTTKARARTIAAVFCWRKGAAGRAGTDNGRPRLRLSGGGRGGHGGGWRVCLQLKQGLQGLLRQFVPCPRVGGWQLLLSTARRDGIALPTGVAWQVPIV